MVCHWKRGIVDELTNEMRRYSLGLADLVQDGAHQEGQHPGKQEARGIVCTRGHVPLRIAIYSVPTDS